MNKAIANFIKSMLAEFWALKPDCQYEALTERFEGCGSWQSLDRAICDFIGHRQPFPVSYNQKNSWPPEALDALEKVRLKREDERTFWVGKRQEIAEISGIGMVVQPPPSESVTEPLTEVKTGRLTKLQKAKLDSLKNNPGTEEFEFFKRLLGLTPAQARQTMVQEYIHRFNPNLTQDEVLQALVHSRTWPDLDSNIKQFLVFRREMYERLARPTLVEQCISTPLSGELDQQYELELEFWDKMRHLIYSLPKPRDFSNKYVYRDELMEQRPERGWGYQTCELCWRMAPFNPASKPSTVLCLTHLKLKIKEPAYRKLRRLEQGVFKLCFDISKRLTPWRDTGMSDEEEQEALVYLMTSDESPLPLLVGYLKKQDHDGTHESLLRAFHGPFPKESGIYTSAMEEYVQETLKTLPFITASEICLAEAWLEALQTDRRKKHKS